MRDLDNYVPLRLRGSYKSRRSSNLFFNLGCTMNYRVVVISMILVGSSVTQDLAAQKYSISGTITNIENGEVLIGATVFAVSANVGATTNAYGFYSLTLPAEDSLTVLFSYVGYVSELKRIQLNEDIVLDVSMSASQAVLGDIIISAERAPSDNVRQARMSVVDVPIRSIDELPAILGEQDVLKVLQLLPGVQAGEEGTTGYHVRGGATDQNLVQLDEATVYNPSHLFGLFSTFNTAALNNVELVTGGFPAYYGGRLSSTLDISMREGNRQHYEVQGGIGLLSTQLTAEGPIVKQKGSFMVSGRRSYFDILARPFLSSSRENNYYLYDINAKLNYQLSARDRVYFSLFTGRDNAEYISPTSLGYGIRFGNSTATLRWNHIYGSKLFVNTSLIGNRYFIRVNSVQGDFFSQNYSGVEDGTFKTDFQYYPTPDHQIRFGAQVVWHTFKSTGNEGVTVRGAAPSELNAESIPRRRSTETAVYFNDAWEINSYIGINAGLRIPYFSTSDTSYSAIEPRLSLRVSLSDDASIKASFTRMNQFVHLIPSSTASVPTDIWALSNKTVKPQQAKQYALGYFRNFIDDTYEASLELYYKDMRNQVLFQEGAELLAYEAIEKVLTFGRGWSYGAELFVRRKVGRLNGWVSYTLSRTDQRFTGLNNGEKFPFKYDRRHNLAIALTWDASSRWSISGNFVYRSGGAYTLPAGRLFASLGGELYKGVYFDYGNYNGYRMGAHHRLDLSATRRFSGGRWFKESEFVLGVYNVYNRLNPYFVFINLDTVSGLPESQQISLLPAIPSISYNFKF